MRIRVLALLAPMALSAQVPCQVSVGIEFQKLPSQSNLYVENDKGGIQTADVKPEHSISSVGAIHFGWSPWETGTRSTGFTVSLMPRQSIPQRWDVTWDGPLGQVTEPHFRTLRESYLGLGIQTLWHGAIDYGIGLELRHETFDYSLDNPNLTVGINGSSSQLRPWIHGIAQRTFKPSYSGARAWFIALQAGMGIGSKSAQGEVNGENMDGLIDGNGFAPKGSLEFQVGMAF